MPTLSQKARKDGAPRRPPLHFQSWTPYGLGACPSNFVTESGTKIDWRTWEFRT